MATLMKDKDGKDPVGPGGTPADPEGNAPAQPGAKSGDAPLAPGGSARDSSGKPPKYPDPPRRGPNEIAVSGGGGGRGGRGGFFNIYKKGQGYWTRMGTVAGAVLVGGLTVQFIYSERATFRLSDKAALLVCAIFGMAYALFAFYMINKASNADFLIATDSEMKKVNWTSKKELTGSTKVVILFMFAIAAFLFLIDIFFSYLFYLLGVLKTPFPT